MNNFEGKVNLICNIANLLRKPYKPEGCGDVTLNMTV